jgi:hypothetical protein
MVESLCEIIKEEYFCLISVILFIISFSKFVSKEFVDSSKTIIDGFLYIARAIPILCF